MKSIFQINTVYQLFITINMRLHNIPQGTADLIVTDHTPVLRNYIENLSKCGLFSCVFYVESLVFNQQFWKIHNDDKAEFFYNSFYKLQNVVSIPQIHYKEYENLYVANLDAYTKFVYKENPHLNIYLIEDGAAVCTSNWKETTKRWDYIKGFNEVYDNVSGLWLYTPDLMCVDLGYEMYQLPKIDRNQKEVLEVYNRIFSYNTKWKFPKFVFLEEPFYADNIINNDLELMKIISDEVGYENFFIKTHPRNLYNRSFALGLAQQKDTPWPFELMYMNSIHDYTVYITVDSGALISTRAIFENDNVTMFLHKIIKGPTRNFGNKEFKEYMNKFYEKYKSKNLLIPETDDEFRIMLKCLKKINNI